MTRPSEAILAAALALCIAGCAVAPRRGAAPEAGPGPGPDSGGAERSPRPEAEAATASYAVLLERLKGGDTGIDFTALRLGFAGLPGYAPYDPELTRIRNAMFEALAEEEYALALEHARAILDRAYVDADAHVGAAIACRETGDAGRGEFHDAVARGLLDSLGGPGAGRDPEHPIVVINLAEENTYLAAHGLEFRRQSLVQCRNGPCDEVEVIDGATGTTHRLYFNVAIPMRRLTGRTGN